MPDRNRAVWQGEIGLTEGHSEEVILELRPEREKGPAL